MIKIQLQNAEFSLKHPVNEQNNKYPLHQREALEPRPISPNQAAVRWSRDTTSVPTTERHRSSIKIIVLVFLHRSVI